MKRYIGREYRLSKDRQNELYFLVRQYLHREDYPAKTHRFELIEVCARAVFETHWETALRAMTAPDGSVRATLAAGGYDKPLRGFYAARRAFYAALDLAEIQTL